MKIGKLAVGIGVIIIVFGIIFYLQGNSIVGPRTSFMYSNPAWVLNGIIIVIAGFIVLSSGIVINLRRPK